MHCVDSGDGVGKAKRLSAAGVLGGCEPHGAGARSQTQVLWTSSGYS